VRNNVLFVTPVAPWNLFGGTPTASRNLLSLFAEEANASVYCLRSDEPGEYPREINGATVLTGPVPRLSRKLKFFFDFSAASFATRQFEKAAVRARFAELLAQQRPGLVVFDHVYSSWLIDLVDDPLTRVAYIAHDEMVAFIDSLRPFRPGLLKRMRFAGLRRQYSALQARVLRRCDFVLTLTPEDADRLRGTTNATIEPAPLYFEFPDFVREYPPEFSYLLITGSFDTWEKQLGLTEFFAKVFPQLLDACPQFRVVVAGRISKDLRMRIRFAEPSLRIVQAPSVEEMREVVRTASAAAVLDVQASGLKIKTMELAATGLPLVSWGPGVEGSALVPGESCLRATTASEFAAHLARLYRDAGMRRRMGSAAREIVQANFSRESARTRWRNSKLCAALATGAVSNASS
jgi:glycosyltransferase involved in cell wall biosynthesis